MISSASRGQSQRHRQREATGRMGSMPSRTQSAKSGEVFKCQALEGMNGFPLADGLDDISGRGPGDQGAGEFAAVAERGFL